jgi:demethylmenaquinone methyltransferase/2-methoxy-6-polyprenyl-1,4-benzoquinol methylase
MSMIVFLLELFPATVAPPMPLWVYPAISRIFAGRQEPPVKKVVPFRDSKLSKKEQIAEMFDAIAFRYDFLNHFLSLGIDRWWRTKALGYLEDDRPAEILDIATGTGDLAILSVTMLSPQKVTGVDISAGMLELGRKKVEAAGLQDRITLQQADSEALPFADGSFDAVTAAFGVRNFEHLDRGLREMARVLRPGKKAVILEFTSPRIFPFTQLFNLYFRYITPWIGKWVARSKEAYSYLPESVKAFPQGEAMVAILKQNGFQQATCKSLTLGICSIYCAVR